MSLDEKTVQRYASFVKKNALIIAAGALGIILIAFGSLTGREKQQTAPKLLDESEYNELYVSSLESRLEETLSLVDGVGRVRVMVTIENGVEYVYATESKSSSDVGSDDVSKQSRESSLTIVDTADGRATVPIKRIEPTIKGVAVVCDGGGEISVKAAVTEAVGSLLGITSNRISVNKMS